MARPAGYTGYYPGEKIPRRPGGGRSPYNPKEYDLNIFSDAVDDMVLNFGDIPQYVRDRFDEGLKRSFKANIFSQHLSAEELQGYTESELKEERGELAGVAGFSINLDPREIAKDPGKWLRRIPREAWRELTDWEDIQLKKREILWMGITGIPRGEEDTGLRRFREKQALLTVGERGVGPGLDDQGRGPLEIAHISVKHNEKDIDIGLDTARQIADFQGDIKSVFFRDGNFDKILRSTSKGTDIALKAGVEAGEISFNRNDANARKITTFSAIQDLARDTDSVNKSLGAWSPYTGGRGLEGVLSAINTNVMDDAVAQDLLKNSIENARDSVNKSKAQIELIRTGLDPSVLSASRRSAIEGKIGKRLEFYEKLTDGELIDLPMAEMGRLERNLQRFDATLGKIEKVLDRPLPTDTLQRMKMINDIAALKKDLTGGNFIEDSIERSLLKTLAERLSTDQLEEVFNSKTPGREYVRKMRTMLPTLERDRAYFSNDDFLEVFYSGKAVDQFLWLAKISPRLRVFTPEYYTTLFMEKMHYFGLTINETDTLLDAAGNEIVPKFFLFKWFNNVIKNNKAFHNIFEVNVGGEAFKIRGSRSFDIIKNNKLYENFIKDGKEKDLLKGMLTKASSNDGKSIFAELAQGKDLKGNLKKFFDGDKNKFDRFMKMFDNNDEKARSFMLKFDKFTSWLQKDGHKVGIESLQDHERIFDLIASLHLYDIDKVKNLGIGITQEFRGLMQHFTQKLSVLQNKIFSGALGKVAGKLIGWKMTVSHALAASITGAITAITGGVGGVFAAPLEKAVQILSRIAIDMAEKLGKSILKADMSEFFEFTEKSFYNAVKFFAYLIAIFLIFMAPVVFSFLTIVGTFTSVDISKIGSIDGQQARASPPGQPLPDIDPGGCFFSSGGYLSYPSFGRRAPPNTDFEPGCLGYDHHGHGTRVYRWCFNVPWQFDRSGGYPNCQVCGSVITPGCSHCPINDPKWHFGFAADFASWNSSEVYLPEWPVGDLDYDAPEGSPQTWRVIAIGTISSGDWVNVYRRGGDGTDYHMHILHITRNTTVTRAFHEGTPLPAGTHIGRLYPISGPHVHIEAMINNNIIRPDNVFCTENRNYW